MHPLGFPGRPWPESEAPRFAGVATFMRLPAARSAAGSSIAVLGVPFDGGTTFRPGARFGPSAMREVSRTLYAYHPQHHRDLFDVFPSVDMGDVAVVPGDVRRTLELTETAVAGVDAEDAFPLVLGGDHSVTLGELRAMSRRHGPLALVQFDSHSDLWDALWGESYSHATFARRAVEEGLISPEHSVVVGLRGSLDSADDAELPQQFGIRAISSYSYITAGAQATASAIRARVGDRPCFLTFDVDVVDPAYAPGTGTPEVGGPPSWQVLETLRRLRGIRLVGADVVEVAPAYDTAGITALLGATVAYEVIALRVLSDLSHPGRSASD